jgi:hypothetical protein
MADRLSDFGHLISSDVHLFQNQINCNEATLCSTKCCKLFVPCATFATGYCNTANCLLHGIGRRGTGNCAGWTAGCGMKIVVEVVVVVVMYHYYREISAEHYLLFEVEQHRVNTVNTMIGVELLFLAIVLVVIQLLLLLLLLLLLPPPPPNLLLQQ